MTALAPLSDADWPAEIAELRDGFAGRLDVYRLMAHHPALLRAWQDLRAHVVVDTALGPERSEVVILRTGHRLNAPYEWGHHVSRARRLGMSDARIAALRGPPEDMAPGDAALARAVDELVAGARLSPATREAAAALVGDAGLLDLMATVGFYSTLAFLVNSFDLPLDAGIRAELEARPPPA